MCDTTLSDAELLIFKSISSFVGSLQGVVHNQRPLALYNKLLTRTTLSHIIPIRKHVAVFREFCDVHADAILTQRVDAFTANTRIRYSDSVYIDVHPVFASTSDHATLWRHMLTIMALVNPGSSALALLETGEAPAAAAAAAAPAAPAEMAFLTGLMEKVERVIPAEASGMEAVTTLLSSGLVGDIVSGMNAGLRDGSLDVGRLLQTVQTVMKTMPPGDNPMMSELLNSMTNTGGNPALVGLLGQLTSGGGLSPEMVSLAQTMTSALGPR